MATGMATPLWRVWKAWLIINWGPLKFTNESRPSPTAPVLLKSYPQNILHPLQPFASSPNKIDWVEWRGLRSATLPHHRTCGFPHPAVETCILGIR